MAKNWDKYSRQSIDLAHAASSWGFSAAKTGTRLGFSIARGVAVTTVGLTTTVVDLALFGGSQVTRPLVGGAVSSVLAIAEQITLAPIHLSEYLTSTSLAAAHSSINVLSVIFPGSSDASFSLASFITLVRREWTEPVPTEGGMAPERQRDYGVIKVGRAIVAWVALQGVTQEWQEKRWFGWMKEMDVDVKESQKEEFKEKRSKPEMKRRGSRIRVTSDVIFPGQGGAQIIAADIGEAPPPSRAQSVIYVRNKTSKASLRSLGPITPLTLNTHAHLAVNAPTASHSGFSDAHSSHSTSHSNSTANSYTSTSHSPTTPTTPHYPFPDSSFSSLFPPQPSVPQPMSNTELKTTLRRLSKMVLAGYGGASLLFFGVSPYGREAAGPTPPKASVVASGVDGGGVQVTGAGDSSGDDMIEREKQSEEAKLTSAIDASEAEARGEDNFGIASPEGTKPGIDAAQETAYSWWDVLLGRHDQEIFERWAGHGEEEGKEGQKEGSVKGKEREKKEKEWEKKREKRRERELKAKMKATAVIGNEHLMPRFWVLTDYGRGQIVLVIRGTMSLNEIAVDLTCDVVPFEPASTPPLTEEDEHPVPGRFTFPSLAYSYVSGSGSGSGAKGKRKEKETETDNDNEGENPRKKGDGKTYYVHGGMLRMAKAMGDLGKPVQLAVLQALHNNPDFELVLCGHSLGAGVAGILGMMWADPSTCLTVPSSGLPVGRRVSVYCFAPPTITDAALSKLTSSLIVSFVYSHDVVARLSLGSVRDLKNAALWLCDSQREGKGEGYAGVTERARVWTARGGKDKEEGDWFIAMRKTLEANMRHGCMYPPGRVLWAMRDSDLHPSHRKHQYSGQGVDKLRLFEVVDVEKVFSQIVFARNMLTAHMPHQYDKVLHDLL